MIFRASIVFWAAIFLSTVTSTAKPEMKWEIINNNRIFRTAESQNRYESDLKKVIICSSKKTRKRSAGCRRFKKSPQPSNQPYDTLWSQKLNEHDRELVFGKTRKIRVRVEGLKSGSSFKCKWKADDNILSGTSCDQETDLELGEHELSVFVLDVNDDEVVQIKNNIDIRDILFVVVGDSFASGEGNPHTYRRIPQYADEGIDQQVVTPGRPATWLDKRCHRSLFAGSAIAAAQLAERNRQISVSYLNLACSGAEIDDGIVENYIGRETEFQALEDYKFYNAIKVPEFYGERKLPTQYNSLQKVLCYEGAYNPATKSCSKIKSPEYILLSTGGNELGFGEIIRKIGVNNWRSSSRTCKKYCISSLIKDVDKKFKKLKIQYAKLVLKLEAFSPKKVLLQEYLDPTHDERGRYCNDKVFSGKTLFTPIGSFVGYKIKKAESRFAYKSIIQPLNLYLRSLAKDANREFRETATGVNWRFIGGLMKGSKTKGYCSKKSWFLRVSNSIKKQGFIPKQEEVGRSAIPSGVLHPNIYGHYNVAWRLGLEFKKDGLID